MADRRGKKKDQAKPDRSKKKSPYRVLLIEDEEAHADLIRHSFSNYRKKFHLSYAATLQDAQQQVAQEPFDLIIADWLLPNGKGIDIQPADKDAITTPVIIMTSHGNEELAVEMLKAGAVDYIVKSEAAFKDLPRIAERAIREWENVRERKKAEANLQESEVRFKDLFNNMGAGVAVYEAVGDGDDFIFRDINRAGEKIEGISRQDVIGRSVLEVFPGVKEFGLFDVFQRVLRTGIPECHPVSQYMDNRITGWRENYVYKLASGEVVAIYEDLTRKKQAEKALEDAAARWQATFNATGDAICLLDSDQKIIQCNQAMVRLSGRSYGELVGRHCWEIIHGTNAPIPECPMNRLRQSLGREQMEMKAGDQVFHVTIDPILDGNGKLAGTVHTIHDITESKKAEMETRRLLNTVLGEKEKISSLINSIADEVWFTDTQHRFTIANPQALSEFSLDHAGETDVETLATSLEVLRPDGSPRMLEESPPLRALAGEVVKNMEEIVRTPATGELRHRQVSAAPVRDASGNIIGSVSVVRDITEQKRAEEALRESEENFRALADNANVGILIAVEKGAHTYANKQAGEITGYTVAELLKTGIKDLANPDELEKITERLRKILVGEPVPPQYETTIICKDRKRVPIEVTSAKTIWRGQPADLVIIRDISERKRSEEALQFAREKYTKAFLSAPDAITISELDSGRFVEVNEAATAIFGYSREELIGKSALELDIWQKKEDRAAFVDQIREHGRVVQYEVVERRKSGELYNALVNADTLSIGGLNYLIAIIRDITKQKRAEVAWRESEVRYRALFEEAIDGICLADVETGFIIDCNQALAALVGRERAELIGQPQTILHPPYNDHAAYSPTFRQHLTDREGQILETQVVTKTGTIREVEIKANLLNIHGQEMLQGIFRDITDRKRAEEAMQQTNEYLHKLIDYASAPIIVWDPRFLITRFNNAFEHLTGRTEQEVIGQPLDILFPEESRDTSLALIKKTLEGERWESVKIPLLAADGMIHTVLWNSANILTADAELVSTIAQGIDITELERAQDHLKESEERYRNIIETAQEGIWTLDSNFHISFVNEKMAGMLGYTQHEMIGRSFAEFIPEGELPDAMMQVELRKKGMKDTYERRFLHRNGDIRTMLTSSATIYDSNGTFSGSFAMFTDITDRKRVEEALKKSQIQLAEAMNLAHLVNWEFDVPTGIFTFDDRFYALYGTTAEREGGNKMPADVYAREFVYPDDQNVVADEVNKAIQATDPNYISEVEHRIIRRDGEVRHIVVRIGIMKDAQGRTIKTHGANQDITDRKRAEIEIQNSRNFLNSIIEQSPNPMWISDEKGTLIRLNKACCDLLQITPEEVVGRYNVLEDNIVEEQGMMPLVRSVFEEGRSVSFDLKYDTHLLRSLVLERSAYVILNVTIFPVRDSTGKITHAVIQHINITERKKAEEALRQSEERLKLTIDATNDGLWDWDIPSGQAIFSPRWYTMLGYEDGEMPANYSTFKSLVHPDELISVETKIQKHIQRRDEGYAIELRMRTKTGDWKWILTRGKVVLRDADGKAVRMVGTHTDINDPKQAEQALDIALQQLKFHVENTPLAVIEFDREYRITRWSDEAERMFGWGGKEIIGKKIDELHWVHEDDVQNVAALSADMFTGRKLRNMHMNRNYCKDGSVIICEWYNSALVDATGDLISVFSLVLDITDRRMMEDEIRSLNKALEQRVEQRTAQLNVSLQDKELLLREVHHRVKNNLQIIISLLNLQSRYITDETTLAAIRESQNRIKAMALVHEKLYQSADISKINLDDYVRFMGNSLFQFYGMKGKHITFTTTIQEVTLDINTAIPVGLIINELISNSLKYAFPEGRKGEISISIKREDHMVTILYKDNGGGIPQDFDWRNAKSLGLRLVISLVEQLGGTIELDRSAGTAFSMVVQEKQ